MQCRILWVFLIVTAVAGLVLGQAIHMFPEASGKGDSPAVAQVDGAGVPAWTWTPKDKVLKILNADLAARTPPLSLEGAAPAQKLIGHPIYLRKDILPGLGSEGLRLVNTPCGLIIAVLEDKGDKVRLAALESDTGKVRWESPGLEIKNYCGFLAMGDTLLVRSAQDDKAKAAHSDFALTAFDLHDGRALWRNDEVKERVLDLVSLPQLRLLLIRADNLGKFSYHPRLYALDLDTGATLWDVEISGDSKSSWAYAFPSLESITKDIINDRSWYRFFSLFYQGYENFFSYCQQGKDLVLCSHDHFQRYDLETGRVVWRCPDLFASSIYVADDRIYALTHTNLVVLDRQSGKQLAEWPVHTGTKKSYPPEVQFLRLDRDILFIHCPAGKDYQLKALDARTGAGIWEAELAKEPISQLIFVGDAILFASGKSVSILDKHTGKVVRTLPGPFQNSIQSLALAADRKVLLQTDNQLAGYETKDWQAVFDTGAIPGVFHPRVPEKPTYSSGFGFGLGGIAGVLSDTVSSYGRYQDAKAKYNRLMERRAQDTSSRSHTDPFAGGQFEQPSYDDYLRLQGAGNDHAFFLSKDGGATHVLGVDARTGGKTVIFPYHEKDAQAVVVDDFQGLAVEFQKKEVIAYRYAISDNARRAHLFADGFAGGSESLRRAEGLARAGRERDAAAELAIALKRFEGALAAADDPVDQMVTRFNLAGICVRLANAEPARANGFRAQARAHLAALLQAAAGRTDERTKALTAAAQTMLDGLVSAK